ncbi:MAG: right-handed parallel beta-helix repeat-containing protein, partial [Halodesulfurarchaeum sp.]
MRARAPWFLALVALLAAGAVAFAGAHTATGQADVTFVEENITQNTTWTREEGPYRIVSNITIGPDATLTIGPGTAVQVAEGVRVRITGNLLARGSPARRITISSPQAAPGRGTWGTLLFEGGPSSR